MKRYDFTVQALGDLRDIGRYTRKQWGIEQARGYREELELAVQKLSLNPAIGRSREEIKPGLRSFKTASHLAFYLSHEDGITIIRLLHPSMDVESAFALDR